MNGKPFVAAYSPLPFSEDKGQYPDYAFHSVEGMNWCVRVGSIIVPWGFSKRDVGFSANGVFVLTRANVSAATLDTKGFRYVKEGDVFYLYESEIDENGEFYGFSVTIKEALMPSFKQLARQGGLDSFVSRACGFTNSKEADDILSPHYMKLAEVRVDHIQ